MLNSDLSNQGIKYGPGKFFIASNTWNHHESLLINCERVTWQDRKQTLPFFAFPISVIIATGRGRKQPYVLGVAGGQALRLAGGRERPTPGPEHK